MGGRWEEDVREYEGRRAVSWILNLTHDLTLVCAALSTVSKAILFCVYSRYKIEPRHGQNLQCCWKYMVLCVELERAGPVKGPQHSYCVH